RVPFLEGAPLAPAEPERYARWFAGPTSGSLYEHCLRAISRGATRGVHGLPLMGAGDWNDGMNRVGAKGLGESVWLGWFLHAVLTRFSPVADARADGGTAAGLRARADALRAD